MKKNTRAIEFNPEGRILNLCALCYLFKHRYFELEMYKMLKVLTQFVIKEFKKSKQGTLDTIKKLLRRAKLLSDGMETDLGDFDLKAN